MFKPRGRSPRRSQRHSKRPVGFPQIFVISFLIFSLFTVLALVLINKGIEPTLMAFAETKTTSVAQKAITVAVDKQLDSVADDTEFVDFDKDNNGNVTLINANTPNVNMMETQTTMKVQNFLTKIENGEMEEYLNANDIEVDSNQKGPFITKIPLGQATNNALFANLGPEVPVRFRVVGNVETNLVGNAKAVAINAVHYKLFVEIKVRVEVIIPFATKAKTVTSQLPIVDSVAPFDVPDYYGGSGNGNGKSSIALPFPKDKGTKNSE